ncbi:MAG: dipeptidyl aminopeptidase/acylaminoacyl peptidase, partial [Myxococcota bacterium]
MSLRLGLIVAVLLTPAVTAAEPGAPLTAPPAAHLTAEVLFADPTMSEPKLSPDGQSLAFVLAKNRFQRVFVRPVVGTQFVGIAEFPTDEVRLRWLAWGSSTRVLLSGLAPDPSAKRLQPWVTRLYSASIEKPR